MASFLVSGRFHSHPSAHAAGDSIGLWILAGSWCAKNSQEGFIPHDVLPMFRGGPNQIEALTRSGLWRRARGGYMMVRAVPAARGRRPVELWKIERDDYRKKIPHQIRDAVYERDGYACLICAATEDLTLDHITPWSRGGQDTIENLRTLCRPCNSRKGASV